jgi:NADPH:quinone reductase-like Zn-dependent oxidoreductase
MRAMVYRGYKSSLELADIEKPFPQAGQLLIKSHCSSINPIDWKMSDGQLRFFKSLKFPVVPGFDIAGEVAAVGAGVQGWTVGRTYSPCPPP